MAVLRHFARAPVVLASQRLMLLPRMSTRDVIETMEDIVSWKDRSSRSAVELFGKCTLRALALLPDMTPLCMARVLFAYSRAKIGYPSLMTEISEYIIDAHGRNELFESASVYELLMLYRGFEVNSYIDQRLHDILIELIMMKHEMMLTSEMCLLLSSYRNNINNYKDDLEILCYLKAHSDFILKITSTLLSSHEICIPRVIVTLISWIESLSTIQTLSQDLNNKIASMFHNISQCPNKFNTNHIVRILKSTSIIHKNIHQLRKSTLSLINKLLELLEIPKYGAIHAQNLSFTSLKGFGLHLQEFPPHRGRRNDVISHNDSLSILCLLDMIDYWNFDLMKGLLYKACNSVESPDDIEKVKSIILKRQTQNGGAIDSPSKIQTLPTHSRNTKISELINLLSRERI